jgi:hypothetical protein
MIYCKCDKTAAYATKGENSAQDKYLFYPVESGGTVFFKG